MAIRKLTRTNHLQRIAAWIPTLLLPLFCCLVNAAIVETTFQILSPPTLSNHNNGLYDHQTADFGFAQCPYSFPVIDNVDDNNCRLKGNLYFIDSTLCNTMENNDAIISLRTLPNVANRPFFIMIPRAEQEDCSLIQQVRNLQSVLQAGPTVVAGVVIADHACLCSALSSGFCFHDNTRDCAEQSPILSNDKHNFQNKDVYLPAILIPKQDADSIKQELPAPNGVEMELSWKAQPLYSNQNLMAIDYWHLPSPYQQQQQDNGLISATSYWDIPFQFGFLLQRLPPWQVQFTPKFHVVSGTSIGCDATTANSYNNECLERCTNNGRYCTQQDPKIVLGLGTTDTTSAASSGTVTGANVLEESLRRMCIWQTYGSNETDPIGVLYWGYLKAFSEICGTDRASSAEQQQSYSDPLKDDNCSRAAMTRAGIDHVLVSRCVIFSGGTTDNQNNTLMEAHLLEQEQEFIPPPPTLIANTVAFRGQTLSESFGAICASYSTVALPEACRTCADCADPYTCVFNGGNCVEQTPFPTAAPLSLPPPTVTVNNGEPSPPPSEANASSDTTRPGEGQGEGDGEQPFNNNIDSVATTTQENSQEGNSTGSGNNDDDRLSDNTKVVIVVAVVGGAIVVIFAFVSVLVWKLFTRIRKLEKHDEKQTPTTTSPAGSGVWNLPPYVTGKEDPFNSEFEPLPPDGGGIEPVPAPNGGIDPLLDSAGAEPVSSSLASAGKEAAPPAIGVAKDVEPGEEIQVEETSRKTSSKVISLEVQLLSPPLDNLEEGVIHSDEKPMERTETSDDNMENDSKQSNDSSKTKEAADKAKIKGKASPGKSARTKTRKSRYDASLIEIMGKAAPEARVPRSFSYEDEEKEEISLDDSEFVSC